MELNEIKKCLYKQNPEAKFRFIRKGVAYYSCVITKESMSSQQVSFEIPVNDMGDADFLNQMDSKLLIRWLTTECSPVDTPFYMTSRSGNEQSKVPGYLPTD